MYRRYTYLIKEQLEQGTPNALLIYAAKALKIRENKIKEVHPN